MQREVCDMSFAELIAEVSAFSVRIMRGDELTAENWARQREVEDEINRRLPMVRK
jgi:hypothetical protein